MERKTAVAVCVGAGAVVAGATIWYLYNCRVAEEEARKHREPPKKLKDDKKDEKPKVDDKKKEPKDDKDDKKDEKPQEPTKEVKKEKKESDDDSDSSSSSSDDESEESEDEPVARPDQLRKLISKTANGALISRDRRLLVIEANSSIDQGLMMLHDNSVTAIPVVDLATRTYLGFFSVLDVAAYMASLFPSSGDLPDELPNVPIKDVVNFSKSPWLEPQALSAPLDELLPHFVGGVQRVLLKDESGKVINIISQTDVLRWLLAQLPQGSGSIRHSSAALPIVATLTGENFQKIHANTPLREALQSLAHDGAVAIIDDEGVLVGDLSPTNLRSLSQYDLKRIYQPVSTIGDMHCVKVRPHATVDVAIRQLVSESKHRIWITDPAGRPKKMVTIPYIIKKLLE